MNGDRHKVYANHFVVDPANIPTKLFHYKLEIRIVLKSNDVGEQDMTLDKDEKVRL